jgi:glutathione S-transferase
MKLYGHANTRSDRAAWALEEAGAEWTFEEVDLYTGAGRRPPYIDLNPGGKVPTLVDGDFVLTESAAIVTYVADRFPAAGLVPAAGTRDRARYDQWCFFVIGELEQPLWTIMRHRAALPPKHRVPQVMETAAWEWTVVAKVLAKGLQGREHIVGDRFTMADLLVGHTLAWARAFGQPLGHDVLEVYAERVLARPAWARARERVQQVPMENRT